MAERDGLVRYPAMAPPIRVLHCPDIVGGHAPQLARSERELGLDSRSVSLFASPFEYGCDEVLCGVEPNALRREGARWRLLWRALRHCDVVHFNFGSAIFPERPYRSTGELGPGRAILQIAFNAYARTVALADLRLLRRLGKAVFVTYQGDDARQSDYCREHFEISPVGEVDDAYYPASSDERKRRQIAAFDRYADGIFSLNPDLLNVLPRRARFLPYANVDPREWRPASEAPANPKPVVVHAPSHRGVKGTRYILDAVAKLEREGVELEFRLVEGLPRSEARKLYEGADLVVDQLLAGWYGGVAVEAMALGKPVVAYLREGDLSYIPDRMRSELPVLNATPTTVFQVLKEWLTTPRGRLAEIGARSRRFIEQWHDPASIARETKAAYEGALAKRRGARTDSTKAPGAA